MPSPPKPTRLLGGRVAVDRHVHRRQQLEQWEVRELVLACQDGQLGAFEELYRRYFDPAVTTMTAVTGLDRDMAHDAVQDAFVRAGERIHQLREPESFFAFLCAIAKNLAHDQWRLRQRRTPLTTDDSTGLETISDAAAGPEELTLRNEQIADLRKVIYGLSGDLREVAIRYFIEMEPLDLIADDMGLEEVKARALCRRARIEITRQVRGTLPGRPAREPGIRAAARKRVNRLPARQRQVLELSEQGLSPRQIAEKLGISANAARVNLCYARKRLAPAST